MRRALVVLVLVVVGCGSSPREAATTTTTTAAVPDEGSCARRLATTGALDQAGAEACVATLRSEPFSGVELPGPDADGRPGWAVVTDAALVEVIATDDGRTLATIDPVSEGGLLGAVEVSDDGTAVWFEEELGAFANTTWSVLWRVPLAGGPIEAVAVVDGLLQFELSPDGWVAYEWEHYEGGEAVRSEEVVLDAAGEERSFPGAIGPWLPDHRMLVGGSVLRSVGQDDEVDVAAAPPGRTWFADVVRPDGTAVVLEHGDEGPVRSFLLDLASGRDLGPVPEPDGRSQGDLDRTGRFPLLLGEQATDCDHVCPSPLYRDDGRLLRDAVSGAAWS